MGSHIAIGAEDNTHSPDVEGGLADKYPSSSTLALRVAPATDDGFNTIRQWLIPVACWRLNDMRFEFDSSFVRAEAAWETPLLHRLLQDHSGAPLSVFGHADPIGDDEYNKQLSGRRAAAIYGLLVRDVGIWELLYDDPADHWGMKSIQAMLR